MARAIIDKAVVCKSTIRRKKSRDLARRKGALESGGLPGKLADCSSREPDRTELYIVEEIRPGGSAKARKRQRVSGNFTR